MKIAHIARIVSRFSIHRHVRTVSKTARIHTMPGMSDWKNHRRRTMRSNTSMPMVSISYAVHAHATAHRIHPAILWRGKTCRNRAAGSGFRTVKRPYPNSGMPSARNQNVMT